jgi:predicted ATPase
MDQHDLRPVIIDQPEGNLDNSSVYDSLVPFLRRAKKRRQMILVTHNPNLVVAADADQVIVATATKKANAKHPQITYRSGSLEDVGSATAIRELAVRLLEGGKTPFKLRDKRWDIPSAESFGGR